MKFQVVYDILCKPGKWSSFWETVACNLDSRGELYGQGVKGVLLFVADGIGELEKRLSIEIKTWDEELEFLDIDRLRKL